MTQADNIFGCIFFKAGKALNVVSWQKLLIDTDCKIMSNFFCSSKNTDHFSVLSFDHFKLYLFQLSDSQRGELVELYKKSGAKRAVEARLLNFLSYNYYHLPMYAKPGMV